MGRLSFLFFLGRTCQAPILTEVAFWSFNGSVFFGYVGKPDLFMRFCFVFPGFWRLGDRSGESHGRAP